MPPKKPKAFDVDKLQKMQPPLTVTVNKHKGNTKQPLHLPTKDGGPPGTGWEVDDVMQLTTYVLQAPLGGGGMYTATVTDHMGSSMEWEFGFDPRTFPEVAPDGTIPSQQPSAQPNASVPGSNTNWLMQGLNPWGAAPINGYAATPRPGFGNPSFGPPPPWANTAPPWWQQQNPTHQQQPQPDSRIRDLEDRLRAAEQQNLQKTYEQQIATQRAESARQIDALKDELRRINENANKGDSETVRLLREQLAELKQAIAAQNNKGESESVRLLREEMRRMQEKTERDRLEAQHREELRRLAENANKGPDPMIEYLRESTRTQAEAQKESARVQREIAQSQLQYMVNPAQLAEMMSKQGNTYNQHMRDFLTQVTGGFDIYRTMMEHALQMTGSPQSPGYALVGEGLARASDIANAWLQMNRDRAVSDAQARAAAAQAQANVEAQQRAQQQQRVHHNPQGIKDPEQLGGTPSTPGSQEEADVINLEERRQPPTNEEMFGEAWEQVQRLRAAVEEQSMTPEQVVGSILQGIAYTQEHGIVIPAFTLFLEGRFADLMDALLPGVDSEFLSACVQLLAQSQQPPQVDPPPQQPA